MASPATPGALMLVGGIGLVYWAVFSRTGLKGTESPTTSLQSYRPAGTGFEPGFLADPPIASAADIDKFMYVIGQIESGGSYTARNAKSGAYGKYQFMPASWRAWSKAIFGYVAPMTPANQELVARRKFTAYFKKYGSWQRVAVAWRSGPSIADNPISTWTSGAIKYVNSVGRIWNAKYGSGGWSPLPLADA